MAPSIDEFEDLTQFADESFDTEEVDLFEFADDEDSPLLRLKSIVLSLDWDITEEILTELNEELASLRALWKDDKVAQIYLQGMENVGKYMQAEGAYAHPNAIKLLLTLYHNYEKIISSPNISSQSITAMLKADIRKFKVLQYQISSLKNAAGGGQEEPPAEPAAKELPAAAKPTPSSKPTPSAAAAAKPTVQDSGVPGPLRSMEATILGLEWEVTDEGLEKFSKESAELRSHLSGNKEAQVLIQGLQALGAYIREQKTNAHPDSFTILHSFYDALKMLLESPQLGAEQRRHILLEQIGSLNSLKEVIARSAASKQEEAEEEEPEEPESDAVEAEEDAPAEDEPGFSFEDADDAVPAVPSRPAAPPEPAAGGGDEDDEFGDDLFSSGGGVVPALADADEEGGFSDSFAAAGLGAERTAELDEKLDSFFNFDDELDNKAEPPKKAAESKQTATPPAKSSLARVLDDAPDEEDDDSAELDSSFFNFDDELDDAPVAAAETETEAEDAAVNFADDDDSIFGNESEETSPASSPTGKEKRQSLSAAAEQDDDDEEDDELDSFFNFDSEQDELPPVKAKVKPAVPAIAEDEPADLFGGDDEDGPVAAALADEKEQPAAEEDDEDELGSDFETFFSFDEDDGAVPPKGKTAATPTVEEEPEDVLSMDKGLFGGDEDMDSGPAAALADEEERLDAEEDDEADMLDSGSLDSFFSFDEDDAAATPKGKTAAVPVAEEEPEDVLSMDKGLFGGDEDTDSGPAAALADEEERPDAEDDEDEADTLDSGSLDSFFSFDEDDAAATPKVKTAATPADEEEPEIGSEKAAEIKSKLDSLFSFEDDALTEQLATDSQNDMPELDDDLITPLDDDEPSEKISDKNLFGADELSIGDAEAEPVTEESEAIAADSLTAAQEDDSFFGSDSEADAAEAESALDVAKNGEEDAPATEEAFFSFAATDDDGFGEKSEAASDEESAMQDEPFGLTDEEESQAVEADNLADEQSDDSFFGFDSGLDSTADAAEAESALDVAENETEDSPATEEAFFSFSANDDDGFGEKTEAASDEEPAIQDEPFGLAEMEEPQAVEADNLADEQGDDSFFGFDSGLSGDGDSGFVPDFAEHGGGEEDVSAAEETEELAVAALMDDAEEDLLLDKEYEAESQALFFGQDDLPDPFASGAEPAEKEAAEDEPVSAELDDHGAVAGGTAFASLAAAASALPELPSSAQLRQFAELASAARREAPLSAQQSIVLNLLDSSATLLAQAPESAAGGGAVMQELASALERAEEPETLAEAVSRYTAWQQDFFAGLLHRHPQMTEEAAQDDSLGLVRKEFSQLKQELLTEFSQLRKEMRTMLQN